MRAPGSPFSANSSEAISRMFCRVPSGSCARVGAAVRLASSPAVLPPVMLPIPRFAEPALTKLTSSYIVRSYAGIAIYRRGRQRQERPLRRRGAGRQLAGEEACADPATRVVDVLATAGDRPAPTPARWRASIVIGLVGRGIQSSRIARSCMSARARGSGIGYTYVLIDFDALGLPDAALGEVVAAARAAGLCRPQRHPSVQAGVIAASDQLVARGRRDRRGQHRGLRQTACASATTPTAGALPRASANGMAGCALDTVVQFGAGGAGAAVAYALMRARRRGNSPIVDSDAGQGASTWRTA